LPLFTELPRRGVLGNSEGMKRAGVVRPQPQMAHSRLYQLIVVVVLIIVDSISQILDMVLLLIS
jgi:hypothetical protein